MRFILNSPKMLNTQTMHIMHVFFLDHLVLFLKHFIFSFWLKITVVTPLEQKATALLPIQLNKITCYQEEYNCII